MNQVLLTAYAPIRRQEQTTTAHAETNGQKSSRICLRHNCLFVTWLSREFPQTIPKKNVENYEIPDLERQTALSLSPLAVSTHLVISHHHQHQHRRQHDHLRNKAISRFQPAWLRNDLRAFTPFGWVHFGFFQRLASRLNKVGIKCKKQAVRPTTLVRDAPKYQFCIF